MYWREWSNLLRAFFLACWFLLFLFCCLIPLLVMLWMLGRDVIGAG